MRNLTQSYMKRRFERQLYSMLIVVLVCFVQVKAKAQASQERPAKLANATVPVDQWLNELVRKVKSNESSYEILLWSCFHDLETNFYLNAHAESAWNLIEAEVSEDKLPTWINEQVDPKYCRCLIRKDACHDKAGRSYDAFLEFFISPEPKRVLRPELHLISQVNKLFTIPLEEDTANKNLPVERLLSVSELKKETVQYPNLSSIDVSYRVLQYNQFEEPRNGFSIRLEFSGGSGTKSITYAVVCALDEIMSMSSRQGDEQDLSSSREILISKVPLGIEPLAEKGCAGVFWEVSREISEKNGSRK